MLSLEGPCKRSGHIQRSTRKCGVIPHNCRLLKTDRPTVQGCSLVAAIAAFILMPRILRHWYLESFLSPSRHSTSAVADKREPRGCEWPPVAWVTKAVADARGKGRRCQAISSQNPSQEFVQYSKSTCPDQGLGHVLIHHYGNTASLTRKEYQNYTPQLQPKPFQAPLETIVRTFPS